MPYSENLLPPSDWNCMKVQMCLQKHWPYPLCFSFVTYPQCPPWVGRGNFPTGQTHIGSPHILLQNSYYHDLHLHLTLCLNEFKVEHMSSHLLKWSSGQSYEVFLFLFIYFIRFLPPPHLDQRSTLGWAKRKCVFFLHFPEAIHWDLWSSEDLYPRCPTPSPAHWPLYNTASHRSNA